MMNFEVWKERMLDIKPAVLQTPDYRPKKKKTKKKIPKNQQKSKTAQPSAFLRSNLPKKVKKPAKKKNLIRLSNSQLQEATKIEIKVKSDPLLYLGKTLREYAKSTHFTPEYISIKLQSLGFGECTTETVLTGEHLSALHPRLALKMIPQTPVGPHDYIFDIKKEDLFTGRSTHELPNSGLSISSIFNDLEAFSICGGLKSALARSLNNRFFNHTILGKQDYYDAHMFAMTAFDKYGGSFLSLCLSLPPLPYSCPKIRKAFTILGNLKKGNPSISFLLPDNNGEGGYEKHYIVFGLKEITHGIDRDTIYLKKVKTGEIMAVLKCDGTITPAKNKNLYRSQLQLFVTFLDKPIEAILSFGAKTGCCSICGKKLTAPESAIRGIGPVCARDLGLR